MNASADAVATPVQAAPERSIIRAHVISHLDDAIANGWIRTYYQPVIRTVTGKVCGVEALARWEDPTYGLLSPIDFIGALEDARLIHKLDACMIEQVCSQLRTNFDNGVPVVPVSFNLSRLDFDLCDIHQVIEDAVHRHEVPRTMINIEITESVFGTEPAFMASAIDRFHDTGYQVWMDDFGSAYSSLNVLKDFDFDELKIDMGFLSRFGEKSRTIVASVVDMAKRLGVQTLAEGVETAEHAEFLRHIGCEKQQGYFYGKPKPFSVEDALALGDTLDFELEGERAYYRKIGSVNTLSLSERDFMPDNMTKDYVTSMPLAFVEYDFEREHFSVLDHNDPFVDALNSIDIDCVAKAERLINDTRRLPARNARRLIENIETAGFARHDYVTSGHPCVMRAKFIARHGSRVTTLITISSAASVGEQRRRERMEEALEALYSIYEHVDIIHLDENYSEPVYSQASFKSVYEVPNLSEAVGQFAENEVYPADRERYRVFMDIPTLSERVEASGQNYIVGFFRMRDRGGDFAWKLVAIIQLTEQMSNKVMICIRDTSWDNDALLQAAFETEEHDEAARAQADHDMADLHMTDGSLWRSIIQNPRIGVFWKNAERQFVGCNKTFLEYYGFESLEAIRGKTDEDMGWHVNPIPYMHDEQRVISEGISTDNVPGQCIAHGELRDIVASKRPVYRNGRIIGLVGYFLDITDLLTAHGQAELIPYTDSVTGLLNYSGLDAATGRFIESYQKLGIDFAMLMIDIDDFKAYNDRYGYDFGDKVLRTIAMTIRDIVGTQCVVGHIYADRFVVLHQSTSTDEMQAIGAKIVDALTAIPDVEGTRCTIYAHSAVVLFSEADDFEELKRLGRTRLHEAKR